MLNKINNWLNIIIGVTVGIFIGNGAYVLFDNRKNPELYAMQSAPWYTDILVCAVFSAAILLIAFIAKRIIRNRSKRP